MVLPGYVRAGDWRKPGLVEWVLARTDWVAVLSCIPLSAGLILYCVTVSAAHGDTKELLNIAQGGQSSLSWLATVYGVTLGITLPLTIIAILYSLLVVAASIYAHRHMYPEDPSPGWPPAAQPQQQQPQQQQQQQGGGTPPKAGDTRWRSSKLPTAAPTLGRLPSNGSASGLVGVVAQPSARSAGLLKAQSLPGSIGGPGAPAPPTPPVLPNLALSLKEDKGQAAGMWERALGLAVAPPGMQSVLSMLGGADPRSARKGPHESAVVDITKLRSPMHRQLPSMHAGAGGAGANGAPDSARSGSVVLGRPPQPPAMLPRQQRQASQQQEAAAKHPLSKGDAGTGATKRLLNNSSSSDHALSDMEKDAMPTSTSPLPAVLVSPKPANGNKRRRRAVGCWARRRAVRPPPLIGVGPGSGSEGGSGAPDLEAAAEVEELRQPSLTPEEQRRLQQKPALRVYRALRGMLLTLIGANTATLVWLVILLVATGAWLVCSQAVHTSAHNTLELYSTPLGAANDALGLTQQNQAAVSTFSQLFGMQFLNSVNKASSGKFNFTSYQQLEAVARERATKLGAAAVVAYNSTVKDPEVEELISPLFSGGSGLCPSTCLDFEYFDFLESSACVCEPDTINHVADLSGKTVDSLIISCVGLGLMILSVLVLLLRFAVIWGQVQTRWALRHAMQLYAAHHEEAAMRRRYGRSTSYVY